MGLPDYLAGDTHEMVTFHRLEGIGDVNSTAKGSGARYNTGKVPLDLIPLTLVARSFGYGDDTVDTTPAIRALHWLGRWQEDGDVEHLYRALRELGLEGGWAECARVFDYGKRKYAEWNWAKGMQWTVPMACAARHLMSMIRGVEKDEESGETHRGHVFCNIVMLLTYHVVYPEGDDRPRCLAG
jgi:hypothetical protein